MNEVFKVAGNVEVAGPLKELFVSPLGVLHLEGASIIVVHAQVQDGRIKEHGARIDAIIATGKKGLLLLLGQVILPVVMPVGSSLLSTALAILQVGQEFFPIDDRRLEKTVPKGPQRVGRFFIDAVEALQVCVVGDILGGSKVIFVGRKDRIVVKGGKAGIPQTVSTADHTPLFGRPSGKEISHQLLERSRRKEPCLVLFDGVLEKQAVGTPLFEGP